MNIPADEVRKMTKITKLPVTVKDTPRLPEAILELAEKRGKLTAVDASFLLGVDARAASDVMSKLAAQGRLKKLTKITVFVYGTAEPANMQLGLGRKEKAVGEGWTRPAKVGAKVGRDENVRAVFE